jgi:hypothetical protein
MYELSCRYDSRNSFYEKAQVVCNGGDLDLYSYGTLVARITRENGKMICEYYGKYSQTTTRHQKEFFKQEGLSDKEIKELFKNGKLEL